MSLLLVDACGVRGDCERARSLLDEPQCVPVDSLAGGRSPLLAACESNHTEVALMLLDEYKANAALELPEADLRPLHAAALHGNVTVLRALLRHGASPNVRDSRGTTALHMAGVLFSPLVHRPCGACACLATLITVRQSKHGAAALLASNCCSKLVPNRTHPQFCNRCRWACGASVLCI